MVIELALPAVLPGLLVALHYGIQLTRPNWGFVSDQGGNRTRWIMLGIITLAFGGFGAALGVVLLQTTWLLGLLLSIISYALIGLGVGASGTSLLALLATSTAPHRRAAAATITWLMMIFGIAMTAGTVGAFLDPYSPKLLLKIVAVVCVSAVVVTMLATWRIERGVTSVVPNSDPMGFVEGLREVWAEPKARIFTIFVFLSMTAYFMQELILEPYAGLVFGFTPGQSTSLSGAQNGGVFVGMLTVGTAATGFRLGQLRNWVVAGCLGSALTLIMITIIGQMGHMPLTPFVVGLGFFNGMFAVAAIGSMMALAGDGRESREGTRMGLWGAAQAIAAGFGGLLGAAAVDLMRGPLPDETAFGAVFLLEASLFLAAALMASRTMENRAPDARLIAGE
jgi:BCD family chlorophyll transporter-like MFS transporter